MIDTNVLSKPPNFNRKHIIGNNQINNSHYIFATVYSKAQPKGKKYAINPNKISKNKNICKNYLLIEHHDKNALLYSDFNFEKIRNSYLLQQKLAMHCPGILPVYQIFDDKNEKKFQVATKFLKNGILSTYLPGFAAYPNHLYTYDKLDPTKKTIIMYGIAQTMNFIHSNRIFFRDLSPDNIFLDEEYHPYLSNFNRCIENAKDSVLQNDIFNYSMIYIGLFGPIEIIQPNNSDDESSSDSNFYSIINILSSMKYGARPRLDDKLDLTESQKDALIRMWGKSQNRPTFSNIIQLFENGKLIFTGTDMDKFSEYKKLFTEECQSYPDKLNDEIKEFCYQTNICSENDDF